MLVLLYLILPSAYSRGFNIAACTEFNSNLYDCKTCAAGYTLIRGLCKPNTCDAACLNECYGTSATQCCDTPANECSDLGYVTYDCEASVAFCKSCLGTTCTACREGFLLDQTNNECYSIRGDCKVRASYNVCRQCNSTNSSGQYLGLTAKLTCDVCTDADCTNCSEDNTVCKACNPTSGKGLNTGACVACTDAQCADCLADNTTCTTCNDFYYLNTTCQACPTGCKTCNGSACLTCASTATPVGNTCQCPAGKGWNGTVCEDCAIAGCEECYADYNTCTKRTGYAEDFTTACTATDCGACNTSDLTTCTSCPTGYFDNSGSCEICSANCTTCSDASTCTACQERYGVVTNACSPCNNQYCLACDGDTAACTSCDEASGYFLATGTSTCVYRSTKCTAVDAAGLCTACTAGYGVSTGNCYKCDDNECELCAADKATCTQCKAGYGLNGVACDPCGADCADCSAASSTCTTANEGFYPSGAAGAACLTNCKTCTTGSDCTECFDGYIAVGNACVNPKCSDNTCSTCDAGYGLITGETACAPCLRGVQSGGTALCTDCGADFKVCAACSAGTAPLCCDDANCVECDVTASVCDKCADTYGVSSGACATCADTAGPCNKCPYDNTKCTECGSTISGLTLTNGQCFPPNCTTVGATGGCSDCDAHYFVDSGGVCTACGDQPYCQECTDASTCTSWIANTNETDGSASCCKASDCGSTCATECAVPTYYGLNGSNVCTACTSDLCKDCSANNTICTTCDFGIVSNICCKSNDCSACTNDGECTGCNAAFYLDTGACVACPGPCATCTSATSCQTCAANYTKQSDDTFCCDSENCTACDSAGVCSACITGYSIMNTSDCCPDNCATCTNTNSVIACTACDAGYRLNGGICEACTVPLCSNCDTDVAVCDSCLTGTTANGTNTECAVDNCQTYTQNSDLIKTGCSKCAATFGASGQVCAACPGNCAECFTDATVCEKCDTGRLWTGAACDPCTTTNCATCSPDAATCTACTGSLVAYDNGGTYVCCAEHCTACTVDSQCSAGSCESGYGVVANVCQQCTVANCSDCDGDAAACVTCAAGMTYTTACIYDNCTQSTNPPACDPGKCAEGYRLTATSSCEACTDPNCATCPNDKDQCTACKSSNAKNNLGLCCGTDNCTTCAVYGTCTACTTGYGVNGSVCSSCTDAECTACPADQNTCTACNAGFHPESGDCYTDCSTGQRNLNASTCENCTDSKCATCPAAAGTCTGCKSPYILNGSAQCCVSNCDDCSTTPLGCDTCASGYRYNSGTQQCEACTDSNCQTCPAGVGVCTTCGGGKFLDNNGNCCDIDNCGNCTGNTAVCQQCKVGFGDDSGNCTACTTTNCAECYADKDTCEVCTSPYTLAGGLCCNANCTDCSSSAPSCNAGSCANGFGTDGSGQCLACSIDKCTACQTGYSSVCTACSTGYDAVNNLCCYEHCGNCNFTEPNCSGGCNAGYGQTPLPDQFCLACEAKNCNACSSDYTNCTGCSGTLVLKQLQCCNANCTSCLNNPPNCDTCDSGYRVKSDGTCEACTVTNCSQCTNVANVCTTCTSPYEPSSDGFACCNANCSVCGNSPPTCTTCKEGYRVNSGSCEACTVANCATCASAAATCDSCTAAYTLANNKCCPKNCSDCDADITKCTTCAAGYGLNSSNTCTACTQPNCNDCAADYKVCAGCSGGLTLTASKQCCNAGLTNCKECSADGATCIKCNDGYGLISGSCTQCTQNGTGNYCLNCDGNAAICQQCVAATPNKDESGNCCYIHECAQCNTTNYLTCERCKATAIFNSTTGQCDTCSGYCKTCTGTTTRCTSCLDIKASPIEGSDGCNCNAGYYNASEQQGVLKCTRCGKDCATCENGTSCTSCKQSDLTVSGGQCKCKSGFYEASRTAVQVNCVKCPEECGQCDTTGKCTTCANSRMVPDSTGKCYCSAQYINVSLDPAVQDCKTCLEASSDPRCLTCPAKFYASATGCRECSPLCATCSTSADNCQSCEENAYLTGTKCSCYMGYTLKDNVCVLVNKDAVKYAAYVSGQNTVIVVFQQPINFDLTVKITKGNVDFTDFNMVVSEDKKMITITINARLQTNTVDYSIKLEAPNTIPQAGIINNIEIQIDSDFKIINNDQSLEPDEEFVVDLKDQEDNGDSQYDDEYEEMGLVISVLFSIICIVLGFGALDFSAWWQLINVYQILSFLPLIALTVDPKFAGFCRGLRFYNPVYNIFKPVDDDESDIFDSADDYAMDSSYYLTNAGSWIFIAMLLGILYLILSLIGCSPIPKVNVYARKLASLYMWGVIIRYFVFAYLDYSLSSFVQFYYTDFDSSLSVFNFILALLTTILIIVPVPLVILYKVWKYWDLEHQARWETLVENVNPRHVMKHQYVFMLVLRRLFYAILLAYGFESGITQVTISIVIAILCICYVVFYAAFESMWKHILAGVGESIILIATITVLIHDSTDDDGFKDTFLYLTIILVFAFAFMSVSLAGLFFYQKIRGLKLHHITSQVTQREEKDEGDNNMKGNGSNGEENHEVPEIVQNPEEQQAIEQEQQV